MKLPDTNVLIYAVNSLAPFHDVARRWIEDNLSETETVAFSWNALLGFIRLTTKRGMLTQPLSAHDALGIVDDWLAQPNVAVIEPTRRHSSLLRGLLAATGTAGNLVSDAHLAALAIEHGATLYSFDNDFSRFAGLRWKNPLNA